MSVNVDEKVLREAERWFARRLEPSVRDSEQEAFERWRRQDYRRAETYADTERLWNELEVLKESQQLRELVPLDGSKPGPSRFEWTSRPLMLALAASLATVIITTFVWWNRTTPVQTITTAIGEQRTGLLPDGTTIRLNTNSALDVRMTRNRRSVTLRHGEVVFDVAKDTSRPFIVAAGDGLITAVGTQFQVRREADTVAVTLIEGRIRLAREARRESEWLDPGQQAVFSGAASGIVRRNVNVAALTSWTRGRLDFRNVSLEDAVAETNRYSARKIRIVDPAIKDLPVSGTFRIGDVDAVATAFEAAFPVRAQGDGREIVLYGRDGPRR